MWSLSRPGNPPSKGAPVVLHARIRQPQYAKVTVTANFRHESTASIYPCSILFFNRHKIWKNVSLCSPAPIGHIPSTSADTSTLHVAESPRPSRARCTSRTDASRRTAVPFWSFLQSQAETAFALRVSTIFSTVPLSNNWAT